MAQNRPGRPLALGVARKAFVRELKDAASTFREAQGGRGLPRTLTRRAEDSFFRVAAALEEFLTVWTVRSLSRDASNMLTRKLALAEKRLEVEFQRWLEKDLAFDDIEGKVGTLGEITLTLKPAAIPDRPTLAQSSQLLRTTDDTLKFASAQDYVDMAMTTLGPKFTRRVQRLEGSDRATLDATRALRNVIAHASAGAVTRMNVALHHVNLPATLRLPDVDNVGRQGVGRYLSQNVIPGNLPRLLHYLETLKDIAYILEPTKGTRPSLLD
jgi:hypothetical protein